MDSLKIRAVLWVESLLSYGIQTLFGGIEFFAVIVLDVLGFWEWLIRVVPGGDDEFTGLPWQWYIGIGVVGLMWGGLTAYHRMRGQWLSARETLTEADWDAEYGSYRDAIDDFMMRLRLLWTNEMPDAKGGFDQSLKRARWLQLPPLGNPPLSDVALPMNAMTEDESNLWTFCCKIFPQTGDEAKAAMASILWDDDQGSAFIDFKKEWRNLKKFFETWEKRAHDNEDFRKWLDNNPGDFHEYPLKLVLWLQLAQSGSMIRVDNHAGPGDLPIFRLSRRWGSEFIRLDKRRGAEGSQEEG